MTLDNLDFFFKSISFKRKIVQKLKLFALALKVLKTGFNHVRLKLDWRTTFVLLGIHFLIKLENITELN